jgi:uncharacterized membrane protein YedE/YeeE
MTDLSIDRPISETPQRPAEINARVAGLAIAALLGGAWLLAQNFAWRQGALFLLGGALGIVLYHALFGFTSAFRVFIADRRGAGLRAQMLMLACATLLFYPTLAHGTFFGQPVHGEGGAVGVSMLFGAFLFGIGMQLGGGCASGTLYTAGGGNTRMLLTLAAFIVGSALGAEHLPWWSAQPAFKPVMLIDALGWVPALALSLLAFAAIAGSTVLLERRRHGRLIPGDASAAQRGWRRVLQGPWPLVWGALLLALGNYATLALAGRPWGITSGFALWGAKLFAAAGVDVASWGYFAAPARAQSLRDSVFADITSVMNFGIILGALLASALAGKFKPEWRVAPRSIVAAIVGGLMLGYGARLAYGCNIGAYFSGIASSSLHGWAWLVAALGGSVVGTALRPWFGLTVERTPRQTAC